MSDKWQITTDKPHNASENMKLDVGLFNQMEAGEINPTIRLYSWQTPSITYGYSQKLEKDFYTNKIPELSKCTAKRPTGGGMVFHNPGDLTYCLVAPINTSLLPTGIEQSCVFVHKKISEILKKIKIESKVVKTLYQKELKPTKRVEKICFATPTRYELITADHKKIAGSAQKKGRNSILIQGTVPLKNDIYFWMDFCKNPEILTKIKNEFTSIYDQTSELYEFEYLAKLFQEVFSDKK